MKLQKIAKLNANGFSLIEIVAVVAIVAVIGVAGFFGYQNYRNSHLAHAGGWTLVNTGVSYPTIGGSTSAVSFKGYACLNNAGAFGTYVRGMVVTASQVPQTFKASIFSAATSNGVKFNWGGPWETGWWGGTIHVTGWRGVNLGITNYINVVPDNSNYSYSTVHASALAPC